MKLTLAFLLIVCDLITGRLIAKHARSLIKGPPLKGRGVRD